MLVNMFKIASVASSDGKAVVEGIMARIFEENPSYWPYGLGVEGHDDVYLIREKQSNTPVGFVGWQGRLEFDDHGELSRTGYYTIGVLPEFRKQGFAKDAVQQIIRLKAATYDRVRAFIVKHNNASHELARSLNVPVLHKVASVNGNGKGCLMYYFSDAESRKLIEWGEEMIPDRLLAGSGRERAPHLTVCWGFDGALDPEEVRAFLTNYGPLNFTLRHVHRFPADEHRPDSDVVLIKVDSEDFNTLNTDLQNHFHITNTYGGYNPHVTLAYVLPGALQRKLDNHAAFNQQKFTARELVYSTAESKRHLNMWLGKAGDAVEMHKV